MARRVRPRLPDGRPRQGEGQARLLLSLLREDEAREADKARLTLGPSARKEWGRRRSLLPVGVILRILDWTAMRGGYGVRIVFNGRLGCGRMETFDLGAGGAMPSTPAPLLNAAAGIRWPSSGASAALAVIRDLKSRMTARHGA